MTQNKVAKFALEFPQGLILFTANNSGVYFKPNDSANAYVISGTLQELFGKKAMTVAADRTTGAGGYSVVHEFDANGILTDARLIKDSQTLRGNLLDATRLQALNDDIAQNSIKFFEFTDTRPTTVFNAAAFPDGRILIKTNNRNELYLGTPGDYTKLDAQMTLQGGNSSWYKTSAGDNIALPYGFGGPNGETPKFNDIDLTYVNQKYGTEPEKYGLILPPAPVHLNPFSPQLSAPKTPAPKAPGQ